MWFHQLVLKIIFMLFVIHIFFVFATFCSQLLPPFHRIFCFFFLFVCHFGHFPSIAYSTFTRCQRITYVKNSYKNGKKIERVDSRNVAVNFCCTPMNEDVEGEKGFRIKTKAIVKKKEKKQKKISYRKIDN